MQYHLSFCLLCVLSHSLGFFMYLVKLEHNGVMEKYHRSGNENGKILCISGNTLRNFGNILRISCGYILRVSLDILCISRNFLYISQNILCISKNILWVSGKILCTSDTHCAFQETFFAVLKKDFVHFRRHFVHFLEKDFLNYRNDFVYFSKHFVYFGKHILHLSAAAGTTKPLISIILVERLIYSCKTLKSLT